MKKRISRVIFIGTVMGALLMMSGCEKLRVEPVKVNGEAIVGHWYAKQNNSDESMHSVRRVYLQVREDGYARYYNLLCEKNQQNQMSSSRSLELDYTPIKRLNHKKMLLQRYPLTPQFELTIGQWPDGSNTDNTITADSAALMQAQSGDYFEVDNVLLSRIAESDTPDFQQWTCK